MSGMTSRERVVAALEHREPDRVPVSLGGTAHKISDPIFHGLREHFGITGEPDRVLTGISYSFSDDRLLDALDTDTRYVHMAVPQPYKRRVHADGSYDTEWGVTFKDEGYFTAVVGHPLRDATIEDLDRYPWPDGDDPVRSLGLAARARRLFEETNRAVVAYRPVPCGLFEMACMLRGTDVFLVDMLANQELAAALLARIFDVQYRLYRQQLEAVGPYIQIAEMIDDYGSQSGLLFSPRLYRQLLQPLQQRIVALIHELAPQAKIMFHSCGAVAPLINDFIQTGFDLLNPLQPRAAGMEPAALKAAFGDRMAFLGGIDVQQTLRGPAEGVRAEVRDRIAHYGPGGGYILAPSHNLFDDVPLTNVFCMLQAAREYGAYPFSK